MRVGLVDVTGQRFGKLLVVRYVPPALAEGRPRHWVCRCDCGTIARVAPCSLNGGRTRSCGCGRGAHEKQMIGRTFGRLTVVAEGTRAADGGKLWQCRCSCGFSGLYRGSNLRAGNTQSCGCLRVDVMRERRAA